MCMCTYTFIYNIYIYLELICPLLCLQKEVPTSNDNKGPGSFGFKYSIYIYMYPGSQRLLKHSPLRNYLTKTSRFTNPAVFLHHGWYGFTSHYENHRLVENNISVSNETKRYFYYYVTYHLNNQPLYVYVTYTKIHLIKVCNGY